MKKMYLFLLSLCFIISCTPSKKLASPTTDSVNMAFGTTVAFVDSYVDAPDDDDDEDEETSAPPSPKDHSAVPATRATLYNAYCAGVWVKRDMILTANHCAGGIAFMQKMKAMTPLQRSLEMYKRAEPDDKHTLGTKMEYIVQSEANGLEGKPKNIHKGVVVAMSFEHDLALVKVDALSVPAHSVAKLAASSPMVGEDMLTVGHPGRLMFSLTKVIVASYREHMLARIEKKGVIGPFIQVSGPIWRGNSGGGLFNKNGELVSTISFLALAPNQCFGIQLEVIKDFVNTNAYKLYR